MSVQLIGFGLAGILRRFLVKPEAMYWPGNLSQVALFVGFHEKVDEKEIFSRYRMSRYKFFWLATLGVFVYSWIPQYFVTVLQSFSIVCLLTSNQVAKFLSSTDVSEGPGILSLTADFYYAGGMYLTSPFYASLQFALSNM
jgi:hypothetical protein